MKSGSVWIHFASSQSDFISVYLQDWVSYCVPVCYCLYIIVGNLSPPHLLNPPTPHRLYPQRIISELSWIHMNSHTLWQTCQALLPRGLQCGSRCFCDSHTCTHMSTPSSYVQPSMSVLSGSSEVGTHLFKHWSLWACASKTHCCTLWILSVWFCLCVCVCVCVCWGGGCHYCPLNIHAAQHLTLHVCASLLLCVSACVSEGCLAPLAQMPWLNPSPVALHSDAKLEHLAPS